MRIKACSLCAQVVLSRHVISGILVHVRALLIVNRRYIADHENQSSVYLARFR
ncbi:hypothetical protein SAMN04488557_1996 [Hyphomicrobium facile]|uniref:Uncharacterized protein n=1 Tax=Hyphomicrobium facile TaxID=51670 RepID=A0A1I7NFL0_9HYPH|nr:hypothetical protein SAMN04488557_1996 [Hyphomicrobium facile]